MAVQQWLGESFAGFFSVASKLGEAVRSFEFGKFQRILSDLGMKDDEITDLWNAIDITCFELSCWGDGDSKLSSKVGLLLNTTLFPRNFLLYRVLSLKYPNTLPSVSVETIPHTGKIKEGRWEYAGDGQKKILKLQFFRVPKKTSPGLLRRRRPLVIHHRSRWW
ncbi:MAG TPA: hypothetical protein VLG69_04890 [Candidatus Andersenbacteria bacterium]|nr:hypothetical protein [Candidatus Andersenbacteria bacterium]